MDARCKWRRYPTSKKLPPNRFLGQSHAEKCRGYFFYFLPAPYYTYWERLFGVYYLSTTYFFSDYETRLSKSDEDNLDDDDDEVNPAIEKAMNALKFVAQHVKNQDNFNSVSWQNEKNMKMARLAIGKLIYLAMMMS